jgi:ribonuclease Z
LAIVPGQKICYVTDIVYHEDNVRRIVALARDADLLFIDAGFLHQDAELAAHKYHLTARQAGLIARAAGVRAVTPLHFSPRYSGREAELREEIDRAFRGE